MSSAWQSSLEPHTSESMDRYYGNNFYVRLLHMSPRSISLLENSWVQYKRCGTPSPLRRGFLAPPILSVQSLL
jgi:hypothetical protein